MHFDFGLFVNAMQTLGVIGALLATMWANRNLARSIRLNALQQMISEMNRLREQRFHDPNVERAFFPNREKWSDCEIRQNIMAVELANVFEWAYLARRARLIDHDVWTSWAETWRSIIFPSPALRGLFADQNHVWTFCRSSDMESDLRKIVEHQEGRIPDPAR